MGELVGNRSVRDFVDSHAAVQPEMLFLITPDSGVRVNYHDLKVALNSFSNALAWARCMAGGSRRRSIWRRATRRLPM
jgi:hypothetical protein